MGAEDVSGSMSLIDSYCDTCGVVVNGSSSILLENVEVNECGPMLRVNGTTRLRGSLAGKTYALGHVYRSTSDNFVASNGTFLPYTKRGNLVDSSGRYFIKAQPQYADYPSSAFVSVKDFGARGRLFSLQFEHSPG